jgi:hypothetical protein
MAKENIQKAWKLQFALFALHFRKNWLSDIQVVGSS